MASVGSVQGLASGIQWQELVTQIMTAESTSRLSPVTNLAATQRKQISAWSAYRDQLNKLGDAAKALRDGTAFDAVKVSGGQSSTTNRTIFNATATTAAAAGNYQVEVLGVAQAEKIGSRLFATSMGAANAGGDFSVNGQHVVITNADTLSAIRDKINAVNTGNTPTGVTATILSAGTSSQRLVLTSDVTGAAGIQLVDGAAHSLQALGFIDGSQSATVTANGGSESNRLTSATTAIGTLLGITTPPPSSIKIGGQVIAIDLATDTLSSIATKINTAGFQATVVEEKVGSTTYSHLSVGSQVVDSGDVNSARTLELLGFTRGGRSADTQTIISQNVLKDATNATAGSTTLLTDLQTPGSTGLLTGGAIQIRGTRGDGSAVSVDFTVGASSTLGDLVNALNAGTGFGGGTRGALASLVGGQIVLTDSAGGASELALSLTSSAPGALDFGRTTVQTTGMQRQIVTGQNARVRLDGAVISSSTNTITDALPGVTLNVVRAEQGSVIDLAISRDTAAIVTSVKAFATAFNDSLKFVQAQSAAGSTLGSNGTLRASMSTLTNIMLTQVAGLSGTSYTRAAIAGLALTKTGTLAVDETMLTGALSTNLSEVRKLFAEKGTASDGEITYLLASKKTQAGTYAVDVTGMPTSASTTGIALAGGVYTDDGTPDVMRIADAMSGKTVDVSLINGDTADTIVDRLNAQFVSLNMKLSASNSSGALRIDGLDVGTSATFTVSYVGGGTDSSSQLGLAAATYAGTDIQGKIGGVVATGNGRVLIGATGSAAEGLNVSYSGNAVRSAGTLNYVLGVGGMMYRAVDAVTRIGDGMIDLQSETLTTSAEGLDKRAADIQKRLDLRQAALLAQFSAMEAALSRIQSQQSWLTSQINAMSSQNQ